MKETKQDFRKYLMEYLQRIVRKLEIIAKMLAWKHESCVHGRGRNSTVLTWRHFQYSKSSVWICFSFTRKLNFRYELLKASGQIWSTFSLRAQVERNFPTKHQWHFVQIVNIDAKL